MSAGTKNLVFTILAIIGAIVVAGWVFKLAFKLIGLIVVIGLVVLAFMFVQNVMGKGR